MVILLFCLMGLYYLSFGPACWLADRGCLSVSTVARAYQPLLEMAWRIPPAHAFLVWYGGIGARNEMIGSAIMSSAAIMENSR